MTNPYLIAGAIAYLLGSIPFGYILVRLFHGEDVRTSGSGNIGATNVARRSPVLGAATLVLDALKGLVAVLLVRHLYSDASAILLTSTALLAVIGHMFPIWLRFHGGKGVATSLGAFAVIVPKSILCIAGLFLLVVGALRIVSLGSILAALAFPLVAWGLHESGEPRQLLLIAIASLLVIRKHSTNISRLLSGSEPRLGAKHE